MSFTAYEKRSALRDILSRYIHTVIVIGSYAIACNATHKVRQRMCKWLLMSSDDIDSDELHLRHEYLATMLAVRRPGVTEVAGELHKAGLIECRWGRFLILNRAGMEDAACECYGKTKNEYERLIVS
jgi:CRP-like cAMP-binding protein